MPGGSVYKDHTFNKETAQYTYMNITKHSRKQKIQKKTQKI
jgi:hypothetical protein